MVEVFKTNVQKVYQADMLVNALLQFFPDSIINFDLDDCDKILRIEGSSIITERVMMLIKQNGYQCRLLK
jgi:hypothetical protein